MKGLDTNVLVRHLTQDDADQAPLATRFIAAECTAEAPCYLNRIVLCELVWVLESAYCYPRALVADAVEGVLRTTEFEAETPDAALTALAAYRSGRIDFADAFLGRTNRAAGCETTATLDRDAARSEDFQLVRPPAPDG